MEGFKNAFKSMESMNKRIIREFERDILKAISINKDGMTKKELMFFLGIRGFDFAIKNFEGHLNTLLKKGDIALQDDKYKLNN